MKTKVLKKITTFYVPIIAIMVFVLFPYVWTLITSIKPSDELFMNKFSFLPHKPTLENYQKLLSEVRFILSMGNSIIVAVFTSLITLPVALMAAYACSRFNFKGKNHTLVGFLLIHMFPPVLLLLPLFTTMKNLGLLNTYPSLVISYCTFTIPFSIWLLTGYLNDIPMELEEAAKIDGCNRFTGFMKVIFPLAAPGMVAATIYIFIYAWNEFLFATMFTGPKTRTLPVALYSFIGENVVNWELLSSGGIVTGIPVIILFMFIQKKLVEGLTAGSVKG
jgi:ABC-type sugar transport system, permease component